MQLQWNQLYGKMSFGDFKLSTKDNKAELLIYDNHGKFSEATPPFAAVVSGTTTILGWRGTNSLSDLLTDIAASPQSSFAWRKVSTKHFLYFVYFHSIHFHSSANCYFTVIIQSMPKLSRPKGLCPLLCKMMS